VLFGKNIKRNSIEKGVENDVRTVRPASLLPSLIFVENVLLFSKPPRVFQNNARFRTESSMCGRALSWSQPPLSLTAVVDHPNHTSFLSGIDIFVDVDPLSPIHTFLDDDGQNGGAIATLKLPTSGKNGSH
jgi:hypothetical protein